MKAGWGSQRPGRARQWGLGVTCLICKAAMGPHRRLPLLPVGQDVAGGPVTEADEEGAESFVPKQLLRLPEQRTCN